MERQSRFPVAYIFSGLGFHGTRRGDGGGGLGESEAGGATAVIIGGIRAHWYSGLANYDPTRTSERAEE